MNEPRYRVSCMTPAGAHVTRLVPGSSLTELLRNLRKEAEVFDGEGRKIGGVTRLDGRWHWWHETLNADGQVAS